MNGFNLNKTVGANEDFNNEESSGEEFIPAKVDEQAKTGSGGNPFHDAGNWKSLFQFLRENLSFTFLLISLIGYIIIASFSNMKTAEDFFRYIAFLVIIIFGYKFYISEFDLSSFKSLFKFSKNWIIAILLLIIFWYNRDVFIKYGMQTYSYLKEAFTIKYIGSKAKDN